MQILRQSFTLQPAPLSRSHGRGIPTATVISHKPRKASTHCSPALTTWLKQIYAKQHSSATTSAARNGQNGETAGRKIGVQDTMYCLSKLATAWDRHDKDLSGKMSLTETTALLNSECLREAALVFANVEKTTVWTEEDLKPLFDKADIDKSGGLSKQEFLALYMSLMQRRCEHDPLVIAEALLGFIDVDKNGRIEGRELKVLLAMLGFHAAVLLPVPETVGIDYRSFLKSLPRKK